MSTTREQQLEAALRDLLNAIDNADVRKSSKNDNARFIDTRSWEGDILGNAIAARAALALPVRAECAYCDNPAIGETAAGRCYCETHRADAKHDERKSVPR